MKANSGVGMLRRLCHRFVCHKLHFGYITHSIGSENLSCLRKCALTPLMDEIAFEKLITPN